MKATRIAVMFVLSTAIAVPIAHGGGDPAAGKARAQACAGCHGASGEGNGTNPALAGMKQQLLVQGLRDYRSGKRASAVMKPFASTLSDAEIENLASYYASLKAKP